MSNEEYIFTFIIFAIAIVYIYKSLFKSKGCNSCGCDSSKEDKNQEKCNKE